MCRSVTEIFVFIIVECLKFRIEGSCSVLKRFSDKFVSVTTASFMATMLYVAIGSLNPVKIEAGRRGAEAALQTPGGVDAVGFEVESGVAEQPVGDIETRRGAINRAVLSWQSYIERYGSEPSYSIGIEGGVSGLNQEEAMTCFAYRVVYNGARIGTAKTVTFDLPEVVGDLVRSGVELGHAVDTIAGRINMKQEEGAVGWLTQGVTTRAGFYACAVVLAFPPVKFPELYPSAVYMLDSEEKETHI